MATSTLGSGTLVLAGTTSGTTTVTATAVAGTTTLTLPAATDTLVGKATTDTLTNKTLTSPTITGGALNGTVGATTPSTVAATTLTTSSTVTHNGGTANGVAYLDGSKVLTTGSALTFDGTNLGVGSGAAINFGGSLVLYGDSTLTAIRGRATSGIIFQDSSAIEQMRLTSTSLLTASTINVGIGTSTPLGRLHTSETNGVNYFESPGISSIGLQFRTNSTNRYRIGTPSGSNDLQFLAGGTTETMRIDSNGNLLVGQTSVSTTTAGAALQQSQGSGKWAFNISGASSSSSEYAHYVYSTTAAAYRFLVDYAGTIYATSIVITAISDQRLKENIRDIDTGLNSIMALKPRRFDWKEGKGQDKKNAAGFIAQEFETVFPECVGTTKAGADGIEYKNINHETLIPTLVKAIQEQQALITTLTARITALEGA